MMMKSLISSLLLIFFLTLIVNCDWPFMTITIMIHRNTGNMIIMRVRVLVALMVLATTLDVNNEQNILTFKSYMYLNILYSYIYIYINVNTYIYISTYIHIHIMNKFIYTKIIGHNYFKRLRGASTRVTNAHSIAQTLPLIVAKPVLPTYVCMYVCMHPCKHVYTYIIM